MTATPMTPQVGLQVVHRRYVPHGHAHYGGDLVDGAYVLGLFGDAATELCIRSDGDEGLFAGYDTVEFKAPVQAGDVVEVIATLDRVGRRSRGVSFEAAVTCRGEPDRGPSAARVCEPPVVAVVAHGTVVVP
jgi:3-aminobutyryl-CoA ammonia-lyase